MLFRSLQCNLISFTPRTSRFGSRQRNPEDDLNTDFVEFQNGSDPWKSDTDGDKILDKDEILWKSKVTGIEGTPPEISNVSLRVDAKFDIGWFFFKMYVSVKVDFDVSDNVGVESVTVKFKRVVGTETRTKYLSGAVSSHILETFEFSLFEALVMGADVNVTTYDVNGNGAWGDYHLDSVVESVAKAVLSFLSAIASAIRRPGTERSPAT